MHHILGLDPGNEESAFVVVTGGGELVLSHRQDANETILGVLKEWPPDLVSMSWHLAIEMVASYGMPVGREVFETCVWIGRFVQAWEGLGKTWSLVYRKDTKMRLCGQTKAKDGNIRQALIDKFGGANAIGTKAKPGPLYGISKDKWAALAVAVTYAETK